MSHETFKQSDDGTHRNVSVIPPTTGREMEQGFQLCSEIHCYTMLRLFLGVPWAVPSQSLSAYEILRQAHSWRHLLPLESNFGLRTAHWLFLHSILESVYFLPFFSPSVRVISHNFTVIRQLSQPFPLPPDFLSQAFPLINLCTFNPIYIYFSEVEQSDKVEQFSFNISVLLSFQELNKNNIINIFFQWFWFKTIT